MTKAKLQEIIVQRTHTQSDYDAIWYAVEAYSSASNNGKPIVSGSLPCRFCDAQFTDEYDLEAHVQFNHNQFSGNDR